MARPIQAIIAALVVVAVAAGCAGNGPFPGPEQKAAAFDRDGNVVIVVPRDRCREARREALESMTAVNVVCGKRLDAMPVGTAGRGGQEFWPPPGPGVPR